MKKLKFFAVGLALVFAVCSAFTSIKPDNTVTYEITGTDGSYYILGQDLTGQTEGVDFQCNAVTSICTMDAESSQIVQRNGQTEVPISQAQATAGVFTDL